MAIIIDGFEADLAVIDYDGRTFTVPRVLLPKGVKEGDVLKFTIEIDAAATTGRHAKVKSLEDRLFKK